MIKILSVYGGLLLAALGRTLLLALLGLFFACIIGMIFGIMGVIKNRVCNIISQVFVDVIRGVPMIVLAFFVSRLLKLNERAVRKDMEDLPMFL